ncbi:MAG: hypothetical protein JNJ49_08615 [Bdellovibrionaceae bacterium]|nr:hypothetical protein [Pseudobdellovibrionaceae bacterium]
MSRYFKKTLTFPLLAIAIQVGCVSEDVGSNALDSSLEADNNKTPSKPRVLSCDFKELDAFDSTPTTVLGANYQQYGIGQPIVQQDLDGNIFSAGQVLGAASLGDYRYAVRRLSPSGQSETVDSDAGLENADRAALPIRIFAAPGQVTILSVISQPQFGHWRYLVRQSLDGGNSWQTVPLALYSADVIDAVDAAEELLSGRIDWDEHRTAEFIRAADGSFLRRIYQSVNSGPFGVSQIQHSRDNGNTWRTILQVDNPQNAVFSYDKSIRIEKDDSTAVLIFERESTFKPQSRVTDYSTTKIYRYDLTSQTLSLAYTFRESPEGTGTEKDFGVPGYGPVQVARVDGKVLLWRAAKKGSALKVGVISSSDMQTWTELTAISGRLFFDFKQTKGFLSAVAPTAAKIAGQSLYSGVKANLNGEQVWSLGTYQCSVR